MGWGWEVMGNASLPRLSQRHRSSLAFCKESFSLWQNSSLGKMTSSKSRHVAELRHLPPGPLIRCWFTSTQGQPPPQKLLAYFCRWLRVTNDIRIYFHFMTYLLQFLLLLMDVRANVRTHFNIFSPPTRKLRDF